LPILSEIRRLVADLAAGLKPEPDCCSNWTRSHYEVARSQGVSPWLHKALRAHPEVRLPDEISLALQNDYRSSLIVSLLREASLRRLVHTFNALDIPLIFLKGAYLGAVVYRDPALRPMCDVDVLVREEHFERAIQLLEGLGYGIVSEALYASDMMLQPSLAFMRQGRFLDTVDLHRALWSLDYYRFPESVIWDRPVETMYWGNRAYFLSPELNFVHLAVHNLNHKGSVRDWLDLFLLLSRVGVNWDALVTLARGLGVVRPMFWVSDELSRSWRLSPPRQVAAEFASYVPHWLEDRVICGRLRELWRLYSRLRLLDGWKTRLDYLWAKVFPDPEYREAIAGNPRWLPYIRARISRLIDSMRRD